MGHVAPAGARLGVAQFAPRDGDLRAKLAAHLACVNQAAERGADLLVFPELSLFGYDLPVAATQPMSADDPRLDALRLAARDHAMTLVVGAAAESGQVRPQLAAFAIAPTGHLSIYAKRHLGAFGAEDRVDLTSPDATLPPPEDEHFVAGRSGHIVTAASTRVGLGICADLGQSEQLDTYAAQGIDAYAVSAFVIPSAYATEARRAHEAARRHATWVLLANFCGPSGHLRAAGQSAIWAPDGECVAKLEPDQPGVAVVQVAVA